MTTPRESIHAAAVAAGLTVTTVDYVDLFRRAGKSCGYVRYSLRGVVLYADMGLAYPLIHAGRDRAGRVISALEAQAVWAGSGTTPPAAVTQTNPRPACQGSTADCTQCPSRVLCAPSA
jgi:hypothetical protein